MDERLERLPLSPLALILSTGRRQVERGWHRGSRLRLPAREETAAGRARRAREEGIFFS